MDFLIARHLHYSYDRTSAKVSRPFITLELKNTIHEALNEYGTSLAGDYRFKGSEGNTFEVEGTTNDGRTWKGVGRIHLSGLVIHLELDVKVSGDLVVEPLPDFLDKMDKLVSELVHLVASMGIVRSRIFPQAMASMFNAIAKWRAGQPVDKKQLRSTMRANVKRIENVGQDVRDRYGFKSPEFELVESARKAMGAAVRLLK